MYLIKEIQTHHITIHIHALKWNDIFFLHFVFYMFMNNFEDLIEFMCFFFYCRFILERFSPETVLVLIL